MTEEIKELKPLSKKHQRVLDEYLICFNQTAAYRVVYPKTTYDSARTASARLFAEDNFLGHLQARLDESTMTAEEALTRLTDMARGDLGEFTNDFGGVDWVIAKEKGLTKLVKKWKVKTITINGKDEDRQITTEEIELHDPQAALRDILKVHGKFTDRVEHSGSVTMTWKEFISGITNADPDSK